MTLASTQVTDSSEYLGVLRSRTSANLNPEVDGQIVAILVHPGDVVEEGQALMRIDPDRQQAAVAQARAARAALQPQLALAQRNLERVQKLVAGGALPGQDLDDARAAVESARGNVQALTAAIAGTQVELGYYRIVAPTHGVVGDIPVRVGDRVTAQTIVTTVTDNRVLEANISIPVDRARDVTLATPVQIIDEHDQVILTGSVRFVSPQVNPGTQSVLVKAAIDNAKGAVRAEQIVRVRVVWTTHEGVAVPALAVTRLGAQAFVFLATPAGDGLVAQQHPVQLGELTNNNFVVEHGLSPGDRVVTSAIQKLRDGVPIAEAPPQPREARPGHR